MSALASQQPKVEPTTQNVGPPVPKERYQINHKTKERLFELMNLDPTSVVADVGATASARILVAGKKVKGNTEGGEVSDTRSILAKVPQGKVFAVNIDPIELNKIRNEIEGARKSGSEFGELVTVKSGNTSMFSESLFRGPSLEPGSVDVVLFSMVLHHIKPENLKSVFQSAYEALKPGGKLVILDKVVHGERDRTACEADHQSINHCSNPSKVLRLLYDLRFENTKFERGPTVFYAPTQTKVKKFDYYFIVASKP